jgi:hypothetical protein
LLQPLPTLLQPYRYYCNPNTTVCVKTYAIIVNTSRTPEEGALSPSWPNRLIIIIIIIIIISSALNSIVSQAYHYHHLHQLLVSSHQLLHSV